MKLLLLVVALTVTFMVVTVHCRVLQGPQEQLITAGPLQGFDIKNENDGQGYTGTLNDDDYQGYTGTLDDDDDQGYTGTVNDDDYQGYTGTLDDDDDQGYTGTLNDDDYQGYTGTLNEDGDQGYTGTLAFELSNHPEVAEGDLYEGDILLSEELWTDLRSRKATAILSKRWTEGPDGYPLVPYRFMDSTVNRGTMRDAMNHYMENTCIKFEETSNINQPHLQFRFSNNKKALCSAWLGMRNANGQPVTIRNYCNENSGLVIHEIGHAIGFHHEHTRSDRDDYVTIIKDNVKVDGQYWLEKNSCPTDNYNVPYDYTSIMHYGQGSFSKSYWKLTIITKDTNAQKLIGKSKELSHRDKLLANRMYNCTGKWLNKCKLSSDPCLNDGYMRYDDNTGQCACICPPGTRGLNCEESFADYYGFSKCNPSCFNGECKNGKCECNIGYSGISCLTGFSKCNSSCFNGECKNGKCLCNTGYTGKSCSEKSNQIKSNQTDCIDKNKSCQSWADIGECKKNPDYMLTNCPKACNQCVECIDKNCYCQHWANIGYCKKLPDYMLPNCAKSCNQC